MMIRTADLRRVPASRQLHPSPARFAGTLEKLVERHILPNLPAPEAVASFHHHLAAYVREPDPVFLVRMVRGMERGRIYGTRDGARLKASDNSPAWWTQYALFQGYQIAPGCFGAVVETMPTHIFDVGRVLPTSAAAAGWHVAHVFDVKDRMTDYHGWSRADVIGRFVRNVHPCNQFLVPKTEWQRWGGDARVIGFFAELYARRYSDVWAEFLALARADVSRLLRVRGEIAYAYGAGTITRRIEPRPARSRASRARPAVPSSSAVPTYRATRLAFKASVIEPLADDQTFRVETPAGTFEMTKGEFYRAFPNVVASASYREKGIYHYPVLPRAAERFRVDDTDGG